MAKYNPANERIKYKYYELQREAKGLAESTIDGIAKALARFEDHTGREDFRRFGKDQAISFKEAMRREVTVAGGQPLSKSTIYSTLAALEAFFRWLAQQRGFRREIDPSDVEYFKMSRKDARIATARRERYAPSLDEVERLVAGMPTGSEVERRDQAVIAFLLLTGVRDGAAASLKLGDVVLDKRYVFQDARHVKTKNSKSIPTFFYPASDKVVGIVATWIAHLRQDRHFTDCDPLFPATSVTHDDGRRFAANGVANTHWKSGATICKIVADAAAAAGMAHFTPHALRTTWGVFGLGLNLSAEETKAFSQNFGHEHVDTTYTNYSPISISRQGEIMMALTKRTSTVKVEDVSASEDEKMLARLRDAGFEIVQK